MASSSEENDDAIQLKTIDKKKRSKVQELIERLEERTCLWNIYAKEYTKRELREKAYSELAELACLFAIFIQIEQQQTTRQSNIFFRIFACWKSCHLMLTQTYPTCWTNIAENVG